MKSDGTTAAIVENKTSDAIVIVYVFVCIRRGIRILIIPDGIHAKTWLFDIQMCDSPQTLILPSINLYKSFLVISKSKPFVAPRTWRDSIGVAAACRRRAYEELALNVSSFSKLESRDITSHAVGVRSCCRKQIFLGVGEECHVTAVHFLWERGVIVCESCSFQISFRPSGLD